MDPIVALFEVAAMVVFCCVIWSLCNAVVDKLK